MSSSVTLINVFEVNGGMEQEFMEWWKRCSDALQKEPGFIDARLHRSLKSSSRFQFVNVAHWETEEAFSQALAKNQALLSPTAAAKGNPALYEVAVQY